MKHDIKRSDWYSVPNILTYIRLLCVPAFAVVFFCVNAAENVNVYIAFAIFVFASATDVLDGFIARKYHITSDLGKMMDPLADKLLQVTAIVCLTVNQYVKVSSIGMLSVVFPIIIGVKELYLVVCGFLLSSKNIIVHSNIFGKIAAFALATGIILSFFVSERYDGLRIAATVVLGLGSIVAYIAAIDYTIKVVRQLGGTLKDKKDLKLKF